MRRLLSLSLVLTGSMPVWPQAASDASISGTARAESGAAIQANVVLISGASSLRAATSADGAFSFSQLAPGTYTLCGAALPNAIKASGAEDQLLDSCAWLDSTSPKLVVASGQAVTGATVSIPLGRRLTIRVNDPAKLLPPPAGRQSGNELSLRISGPAGVVHRIPIAAQDPAGRTYAIVLPYNAGYKLSVQSTKFVLDHNAPAALQSAHGDPGNVYVINIKGAK